MRHFGDAPTWPPSLCTSYGCTIVTSSARASYRRNAPTDSLDGASSTPNCHSSWRWDGPSLASRYAHTSSVVASGAGCQNRTLTSLVIGTLPPLVESLDHPS